MERGRRIKREAMRPKEEPETQASPRGRSGRSPSPRRSRSPRTLEDLLECKESVPPRKLVKKEKKEKQDKEKEEAKKRRLIKMRRAGIMIIVPTWGGPDCCAACEEPVTSYEKNWTSSEGGWKHRTFVRIAPGRCRCEENAL